MKKVFIAITMVLLFFAYQDVSANQVSGPINTPVVGRVVEVIDADALAVRLNDGEIVYVRLLGVDASTKEGGFKYMQDNAFGKTVTLVPEYSGSSPAMQGRYNYVYVYLSPDSSTNTFGRESFNVLLVRYGFAEIDGQFRGSLYNTMAASQSQARALRVGIWNEGSLGIYLSSERININTADVRDFMDIMTGRVTDTLVYDILAYRQRSPFKSVSELKFVKGMTKEIYGSNRHLFTVITNINTAGERELRSLHEATRENVENILRYRTRNNFTSLDQLHRDAGVEYRFFERNRPYMAVNDSTRMTYAIPEYVVNLNTASEAQLRQISDVGNTLASRIIAERRNGYTFKTLGDLNAIHRLSAEEINALSDNLNIYTDINNATRHELQSLFGNAYIQRDIDNIVAARNISDISRLQNVLSQDRYDRIKDHIYAGEMISPERVNINTANEAQLRSTGMSMSEARSILSRSGSIRMPSQIPVNVARYDTQVSLYTNINTATVRELHSLNAFPEDIISQIITYRDDQPFGSVIEVEDFFMEHGYHSRYRNIRDFIVVR